MNIHGGDLAEIAWETFDRHRLHQLECVAYGRFEIDGDEPWNISIECMDCGEVVIDVDNPKIGDEYVV